MMRRYRRLAELGEYVIKAPMATSELTTQTTHALKWGYISMMINSAAQIGVTALLARLLDAHAFGLIAGAMFVLRFGQYFSEMGMGSVLVQKVELTENDIRMAFSWSVLCGAFFTLLAWISAPLSLEIVVDPAIIPVMKAMGFSFVVASLGLTAQALLRRNGRFQEIAIIETTSYVLGYTAVTVILALMGAGVWSLVAGALTQSLLSAFGYFFRARHSVVPLFSCTTAKTTIGLGWKFSLAGFVDFLSFNVDNLLVGRTWGAATLGVYTRAINICSLPSAALNSVLSDVLFSSFASIQRDQARLRRGLLLGVLLSGLLVTPVALGMIVGAGPLVLVLLGPKWVAAIPLVQVMSIIVPLNLVAVVPAVLLDSVGKVSTRLWVQVIFLLLTSVLILIAFPYGIIGIVWATVITQLIRCLLLFSMSRKVALTMWKDLISACIPGIQVGTVALLLIFLANRLLDNMPASMTLAMDIALGAMAYLSLIICPTQAVRQVGVPGFDALREQSTHWLFRNRLADWYLKRVFRPQS